MPGRANMGKDWPKGGGGARQSHEEPGEPWRVLSSSAGTWNQRVGRGSQEKPGRAKMCQDKPKRRGEAMRSQGGCMASSVEFRWDLEPGGGQEEPRDARKGQ